MLPSTETIQVGYSEVWLRVNYQVLPGVPYMLPCQGQGVLSLCKMIDHLHIERNNIGRELGPEAMERLYKVVEELSKLRYEMQTNMPIIDLVDRGG